VKSGFQRVSKQLPYVGPALTVAFAGFNIAGIESRKAAGEISEEQARIEKSGVVGGAAGAVAGFAGGAKLGAIIGTMILPGVGTAIGGLLGGAIGAWGGEALGSELGESLMSNWGSITKFATDMGKTVADSWASTKNWLATDGQQYWNMFTSGAKEVGKMALGLLEQVPVIGGIVKGAQSLFASASEKFKSAGQTIRGFLDDSAAKFRATFPELTAGVEKVVGGMKAGLGTLMDSMTEKASAAWGWIKEKTGLNTPAQTAPAPTTPAKPAPAPTTPAKPAPAPSTPTTPAQTAPAPTTPAKPAPAPSTPTTPAQPAAPPGKPPTAAAPVKSTPQPRVDAVGVPQKKDLTAQEKAAIYETIATNTKYTNDLMQAQQRAMNSMLQQLAAISGHTNETAVAAKKTAQRVN